MDLRITLAPDGGLRLILPAGRHLDVGTGASAMHYIKRILVDANAGIREQRGYIREFPTQHIIDIWRKQDEAGRMEAKREEFKERGIDLETLDFQL
jgi:hypothetical protein